MKREIRVIYTAIAYDEEKTYRDPVGRENGILHYDLALKIALSESQMKAIINVLNEFKQEQPFLEPMKFEMRRLVDDD